MGSISKISDYVGGASTIVPLQPLVKEVLNGEDMRIFTITVPIEFSTAKLRHYHSSKRLIVVDGAMMVHLRDGIHRLVKEDQILIPATEPHSYQNIGRIPLKLVEIRTGSYLDDDEIVGI